MVSRSENTYKLLISRDMTFDELARSRIKEQVLYHTTKEVETTMKKMEFEIPNQQSQVVRPNLVHDDDSHVGGDSNLLDEKDPEEQQP